MGIWTLRLSILGTLAAIIGVTTLVFTAILNAIGAFSIFTLILLIIPFNIIQWLIAPYMIDAFYRVKEVSPTEEPELHRVVERLSARSGIKKPKVMVAHIPIPNAFAYGSPIAGTRVAVTTELLKTLDMEEVEAVLGHEIGHLKHRDVQVMMFVSILPAIFYYLGWSLLWSRMYSREERGGGAVALGLASIIVYWVLTLLSLHLSRLREYYADRHSVSIVDDGARKLSEALAKISMYTSRVRKDVVSNFSSFKALFISDPERARSDALVFARERLYSSDYRLVERILRRKITMWDRIVELFSTHPNIVKRIRALQEMA
ncbi:M48 family metalloprotease [Candidatus Bathyarchaeota archaeon]|nr:M48 family metalloprotease [Candidatus Bathyarchaeota archaeon]